MLPLHLLPLSFFASRGCCKLIPCPWFLVVADIFPSPNECSVMEIREQVETLASLMSKSEPHALKGPFFILTNAFIVSSWQTLCLNSAIDVEKEHETEARVFPLSKTTARIIPAQGRTSSKYGR
jgi:hypothetical protein